MSLLFDGIVGKLYLAKGLEVDIDLTPIVYYGKYRQIYGFVISGASGGIDGKYRISGIASAWRKQKFVSDRNGI